MNRKWLKTALTGVALLVILATSLSMYKPQKLYKDQVAVLMYHHIDDEVQSPGTISSQLFHDQLAYLKSQGYQFITLDVLKRYFHGGAVPPNAVYITFDDGYESFYTKAYPILKELQIPAVNFVITKDLQNPKASWIPSLSREEIKTMASSMKGLDFQCHTNNMHDKINGKAPLASRLTDSQGAEETDAQYRQRITDDTKACIDSLKGLYGSPIETLAYPFGMFNKRAAAIIHDAGIQFAFTVLPRMATRDTDPLKIPRLNAGSPYTTPEGLHNMIMRRVTLAGQPAKEKDAVVLRDTIEQIGGELTVDKSGNKVIHYNGSDWTLSVKSSEVTHNGLTAQLSEPLKVEGNRTFIRLDDLQKLLGITISFDPYRNTFTAVLPDESGSDPGADGGSIPLKK